MNTTRRTFTLGGTAALVTAATAACSSSSAGGSGGEVELTWWATNSASTINRDMEILTPIAATFTEQTGIKVKIEIAAWADYYNKVLGAISSGEGPDVMGVGTTWTQTLADTGAFLQFDDERMEAVGGRDKFVAASLKAAGGDTDGGPSFLPLGNGVTNLWYNPTKLAAVGVTEPPRDWDGFIALAKQLTNGTDQWGFGYAAGSAQELSHTIFALGRQFDGEFFDADGKPTLDADGIVEAAKFLTDLLTVHEIMSGGDVEAVQVSDITQDFISGRVAMMFAANPVPAFVDAGYTDYVAGYIPVLQPPKGDPVQTHIAGVNFGVFAETEHETEALQLIKYLTDVESQVALYQQVQSLPTNQSAYDSDQVEKTPEFLVLQDVLQNFAETFPLNSKTGQAETLVGDAMKQIFANAALNGPQDTAAIKKVLEQANTQLIAAG